MNGDGEDAKPEDDGFAKVDGSTNVDAWRYDQDELALTVRFRGGATYAYDGVTPEQVEAMKAAPSKGVWIRTHLVAAGVPYRKLEPKPKEGT